MKNGKGGINMNTAMAVVGVHVCLSQGRCFGREALQEQMFGQVTVVVWSLLRLCEASENNHVLCSAYLQSLSVTHRFMVSAVQCDPPCLTAHLSSRRRVTVMFCSCIIKKWAFEACLIQASLAEESG